MSIQTALKGQYHAALAMLRDAVEKCPPDLWNDGFHPTPFWRVAYHTLYFTDLYLRQTLEGFRPWALHRGEHHDLPWPPGSGAKIDDPYTPAEILDYWRIVDGSVDAAVDRLDLSAPCSGVPWHPTIPKLDHQLHNLRHVQHHAALLAGRLRRERGLEVDWVRGA